MTSNINQEEKEDNIKKYSDPQTQRDTIESIIYSSMHDNITYLPKTNPTTWDFPVAFFFFFFFFFSPITSQLKNQDQPLSFFFFFSIIGG